MQKLLFAATILASGLCSATADAMPAPRAPASPDAGIIPVMQGCGPYGHRDPYGRCVANRPPPRYGRACPPGYHLGPYGRACRPNY